MEFDREYYYNRSALELAEDAYNISRDIMDSTANEEVVFNFLEAMSMKMLSIFYYYMFLKISKKSMIGDYNISTNIMDLPVNKQAYNNGIDFAMNSLETFNILNISDLEK